jgi:hypothetical protein
MFPASLNTNVMNSRNGEPVLLGDNPQYRPALPEFSDFSDYFGIDFSGATLSADGTMAVQNLTGMLAIFQPRNVFQIAYVVICAATVFVIDLVTLGSRAEKGAGHHNVDEVMLALRLHIGKTKTHIARIYISVYRQLPVSAFALLAIWPVCYAAHVSTIADFVDSFVTNNRKPSFDLHGFKYSANQVHNSSTAKSRILA